MSNERQVDIKEFPVLIKEGKRLCRWCQRPIKPPRRTICSDECVHEIRLRTDTSYVRQCLKKRDKEICAHCKLDCKSLRVRLRLLYKLDKIEWLRLINKFEIPKNRRHKSLWDADHIIPVCEGGGLTDLDNYRTLCIRCHRAETNQLLKERRRG